MGPRESLYGKVCTQITNVTSIEQCTGKNMSNDIALSLNARVIIPKSGAGTIAFLGTTDFAAGSSIRSFMQDVI